MDNINVIDKLNNLIQKEWIQNPEIEKTILKLKEILDQDQGVEETRENLIYVPMNPIIKETKDLGGAEAVAFVYNVLGTAAVNSITQNTLALSIAGPVIEKIWFFMWELIKAVWEHNKTGKPISKWFKENITNGIKNLLVDIGVHDTIYTGLMAYGINNNLFDARVLAIFSFMIALPPAIFVKYSGNELLHYIQKNYTKLHGFKREKYYEARFIMDHHPDPKKIFEQTTKEFWLENYNISSYRDTYFNHNIPTFSERTGTLKTREIMDHATGNTIQNLEIAHTLPTKNSLEKNDIYNFFYSSKEKWKKDISWKDLELLFKKYPYKKIIWEQSKEINFDREICFDNEIRLTLDDIKETTNNNLKCVIEVKAYKDTKQLMEVMKFIMRKWRIQLTTQWKQNLI